MNTITQTLTLAQLREDLERLASAHPGSYPTNVIEVIHQCGEITVDAENEEDALREALEESGKEFKEATARAEKAEGDIATLREEMSEIRDTVDPDESVASYRERALAAENGHTQMTQICRDMTQICRDMRYRMEDMERELKALRARKGISAGVFRNIQNIHTLLATVARSAISKQHADEAATILMEL